MTMMILVSPVLSLQWLMLRQTACRSVGTTTMHVDCRQYVKAVKNSFTLPEIACKALPSPIAIHSAEVKCRQCISMGIVQQCRPWFNIGKAPKGALRLVFKNH